MATRHWTTADIPDQSGRVAVVTGSNTGLGLATAEALAGAGAEVVMAVRNPDKGEAARTQILEQHPDATIHIQSLDLASLESVRAAADELLARYDRLDRDQQRRSDVHQVADHHRRVRVADGRQSPRRLRADLSAARSADGHARLTDRQRQQRRPQDQVDARPDHDDVRREVRPHRRYGRSKLANRCSPTSATSPRCCRVDDRRLGAHPGVSATELAASPPPWSSSR